ncbi:MAG: hypothetical protein RL670_842 [Actinomycetota bacterium]
MFNRKLAALALSATVLLGTSACSFSSNIPTLQMYAPSEGVDADTTNVALRNFIYLSNGTNSELIGSAVNTTNKVVKFSLTFETEAAKTVVDFELAAGEKLDIGYNGNPGIALPANGKPGDIEPISVTEGSETVNMNVPILDGSLPQYAELVKTLGTPE